MTANPKGCVPEVWVPSNERPWVQRVSAKLSTSEARGLHVQSYTDSFRGCLGGNRQECPWCISTYGTGTSVRYRRPGRCLNGAHLRKSKASLLAVAFEYGGW